MEDAMLAYLAYADRAGVITITDAATAKPTPPPGTQPIAMHRDRDVLEEAVAAVACRAADSTTLLVPQLAGGTKVTRAAVFELIRQVENRLLFAAA